MQHIKTKSSTDELLHIENTPYYCLLFCISWLCWKQTSAILLLGLSCVISDPCKISKWKKFGKHTNQMFEALEILFSNIRNLYLF